MPTNHDIVTQLWKHFDARKFEKVRPLLHDEFVCVWPQSEEVIRGADNFIAINENYPGKWACTVKRIVESGDTVVSEVEVSDGKTTVYAVSFFEFADGKIIKATEYWCEPYEAPEWRKQWVDEL